MARVLFRFRAAQTAIDHEFAGKRIAPRVTRSRSGGLWGSGFSQHINSVVAIYDRRKNFPLFSLPELPKRADVDRVRGVFLDHEFARRAREDIGTANGECA